MAAKKREGRICQQCLETIYETDDLNWYLNQKSFSPHYSIMCDKCAKKEKVKAELLISFSKYKPLKNFIEGSPTKTGTKRYYFKRDGKIVLLTSESGQKKGLTPAKKKDI